MPQIKQRLVLAHWMIHQLGFPEYGTGFTTLNEALKRCDLGRDEQNVFHYRRALDELLAANPACPIISDFARTLAAT